MNVVGINMFYGYIRVSTDSQEIGRQKVALSKWQEKTKIDSDDNNIFIDYYTGKTFNSDNYKKMKSILKSGDYIVVKEVDRLGRDWDGIKKEWQELKDVGVNIIIIDIPILSDKLPGESEVIEGLDLRFIKEQILNLMCYSAQKERERISMRTKEGLNNVKINGSKSGKSIGHPRTKKSSKQNFINTLIYMVENNVGQKNASFKTSYPTDTFKRDLKRCYEKYNTKDYKSILDNVRNDIEWLY